jgi:hypothetical protein
MSTDDFLGWKGRYLGFGGAFGFPELDLFEPNEKRFRNERMEGSGAEGAVGLGPAPGEEEVDDSGGRVVVPRMGELLLLRGWDRDS